MIRPGLYEHYKGNQYQVHGVALHTETREHFVVYQAMYGEYLLFVRPLEMFLEGVEKDGVRMPRFRYLRPLWNQNEAKAS